MEIEGDVVMLSRADWMAVGRKKTHHALVVHRTNQT